MLELISSEQSEIVPALTLSLAAGLLTYSDPAQRGQLTMTASQFRFEITTGSADQCQALECSVAFGLQCEGTEFAAFAVNDFDFLFNGRAMFGKNSYQRFLPLSGKFKFGQYAAPLRRCHPHHPRAGHGMPRPEIQCHAAIRLGRHVGLYPRRIAATIEYKIHPPARNTLWPVHGLCPTEAFALNFPMVGQDFKCNRKPV